MRKVLLITAGLLAAAGCKRTSAQTTVHAANLIEVGGAPGEVQVTAVGTLGGKATAPVTATLPSFPWNGRTVAAVPALPVKGGDSWTLTFVPPAVPARTVTLVASAASGTPGKATLDLLDQLARLDTALHAPSDPALAAKYAQADANLQAMAAAARATIAQAQTGAVPIGGWNGVTVSLDAAGLAVLDGLVAGAQEPVVALSALSAEPTVQALSTSTAVDVATLLAGGIASGLAIGVLFPASTAAAAGVGLFLAAPFLGEVMAQQALDLAAAADPAGPAGQSSDALQWGTNQHANRWASDLVTSHTSGSTQYSAFLANTLLPAFCDAARCAAQGGGCLACSSMWIGCFSAGSTCYGTGDSAVACPAYAEGKTCEGLQICVMKGADCPPGLVSGGITYTISISTSGGGSVSADPPGSPSLHYPPGTPVTLSATPNDGYTFLGWGGDCSGMTCSLVMSSDRVVVANFSQTVAGGFALTTAVAGAGAAYGSIARDKPGPSYPSGDVVTLTAQFDSSHASFHGWSGDCAGAGSCALVMDADKSVTATFDLVDPNDPCGAAGTWTTSCPSALCCASCSGNLPATGWSFTVSAQIAKSGGSWTDNPAGDTYTFTPSTCLLTTYGSQTTACWNGYTWQRTLRGGAGSFNNVCGCWSSSSCNCTGYYTCTDARQ